MYGECLEKGFDIAASNTFNLANKWHGNKLLNVYYEVPELNDVSSAFESHVNICRT